MAVVFVLGFIVFSCEKDDDFLSLSINKIDIPVTGKEATFTISSNAGWSISTTNSWVSVDQSTGNGEASVTLKVEGNYSDTDRSAILTVSSGSLIEKLTITQSTLSFSLSKSEIVFDASGTASELRVTSNSSWSLTIPADAAWCTADPLSGEGDAIITLKPVPYTERVIRVESPIVINSFNTTKTLLVSQEFTNEAPSAPVLLTPENTSKEVALPVSFTWEAATDADGDDITYQIFLSTDGQTWGNAVSETTATKATFTINEISEQTTYYWKVVAKDQFDAKSESDVYQFTSKDRGLYSDGEVAVYQTYSASGANAPVNLVIVGDGFIDQDYMKGGAFDAAVEKAVNAFFSVEPYPTYRNYFTVHKVAAYSQERGATVETDFTNYPVKKQTRKTVFNSILEGGKSTGIRCDYGTVFKYALKVPGMTETELRKTTIIVILNLDVYAGTTIMYTDGRGIALCPTGDTFEEIVCHEGGGHAFGRLLDEYIYYPTKLPAADAQKVTTFRQGNVWSFGGNLSLTSDAEDVHWKHYFEKPGYEMVGIYEGAYLYEQGVWRPEENSCMNDNAPYFNAPSREAIVRRIMSISGRSFNYNNFYANDKIQTVQLKRSRAVTVPLAPPILKE